MGTIKEKLTLSKHSPTMIHDVDYYELPGDLSPTLDTMAMKERNGDLSPTLDTMAMKERDELTSTSAKKRHKDKSRKKVKKETSESSNERRSSRKKEKKLSLSSSASSPLKEARESSNERRSSRKKKSSHSSSEAHKNMEQQLNKTKETETRKKTQILARAQRHTPDPVFALQFASSTSSLQSNSSSFSRLSAMSALNRSDMQSLVECIRKDKMKIEKRLSCGSCAGGVRSVSPETEFECERILQKWNSMSRERKEKFGSSGA